VVTIRPLCRASAPRAAILRRRQLWNPRRARDVRALVRGVERAIELEELGVVGRGIAHERPDAAAAGFFGRELAGSVQRAAPQVDLPRSASDEPTASALVPTPGHASPTLSSHIDALTGRKCRHAICASNRAGTK
jgi:hypothetical protein